MVIDLNPQEIIAQIDKAFKGYAGDLTEFESAVGAFILGRKLGWRALLLVHDRRTISKYERHIGLTFREYMRPDGEWASKSVAWGIVEKGKNFWKAVRGEIQDVRTPEIRRGLA